MRAPAIRALFLCSFLCISARAGTVLVGFECHSDAACALSGALVLRSVTDSSVVRRIPIEQPNRIIVAEAAGSEWDASLDAKGFWALPQRLSIPAGDVQKNETVPVWRTGRVHARIKADPPPDALRAVVASAPDRRATSEIPRATSFDCTKQSNEWRCDLPATTLDVAFHAAGFAPHYIWDVKVSPARASDLGTFALVKGASLVAWLDPETLKNVKPPIRAILRHHVAGDPSPTLTRLSTPVAEGVFTAKGMVQLAPLAAGRYVLETQAKGFVPARIPVEVSEARESTLRRSIELFPAVTARFRFDPPLAPDGTPWQMELWRRNDFGSGWERGASGFGSADGTFEAPDQAEGVARLVLRDAKRNVLANRELTIVQSEVAQLVTVDVATIAGEVLIADEALPRAVLVFGGSGGTEKVRATADDNGKFTVVLPRRGKWVVDVDAADAAVSATAEVEVPENRDEIRIQLPSTEFAGWVVRANGERVGAAEVALLSPKGTRKRMSDADGTFRFRGVRGGTLRVQATDPQTRAYSRIVEVIVPEEGVVSNVALAIENLRQLKGVVRSQGNAVAGARVNGYAFVGGAAQQERVTTDIQGAFALDAPESAREMVLVVGAPGRPLYAVTVPITSDPALLDVPARGGSLHLRWPDAARPLRVFSNDTMVPLADLIDWARAHGEPATASAAHVPNVAAGRYRLCTKERCVDGILSIGGLLDLDLTANTTAQLNMEE